MNHSVFKKISVILSAMLVVNVVSVNAFALTPNSLPNLDETMKGSITVHKYQTENPDYVAGEGTGLITDGNSIDTSEFSALDNIEFTVFQIGGIDVIGDTQPVYDSTLLTENVDTGKWYYDGVEEISSALTIDGEVAFTSLELGRYLVIETETPESVTEKSEPFFVDLPMTNPNDNSSWMYDVHAFPKNVVKYDTPDIPSKSITEIGNKHDTATVGDVKTWIIESGTPTTIHDYNKYVLSDTLDEKIGYVTNSITVKTGASYDTAVDVDSNAYVLTLPTTETGDTIEVSFTEDYLSSFETPSTDTLTQ